MADRGKVFHTGKTTSHQATWQLTTTNSGPTCNNQGSVLEFFAM
jgi:hypothetical protein